MNQLITRKLPCRYAFAFGRSNTIPVSFPHTLRVLRCNPAGVRGEVVSRFGYPDKTFTPLFQPNFSAAACRPHPLPFDPQASAIHPQENPEAVQKPGRKNLGAKTCRKTCRSTWA
jgi:hypothetical protein